MLLQPYATCACPQWWWYFTGAINLFRPNKPKDKNVLRYFYCKFLPNSIFSFFLSVNFLTGLYQT